MGFLAFLIKYIANGDNGNRSKEQPCTVSGYGRLAAAALTGIQYLLPTPAQYRQSRAEIFYGYFFQQKTKRSKICGKGLLILRSK
ncbi:hypothetical protein C7N43_01300 [Sphingobacteriales bacterium UPWRP_1]|nr:hypothetical protein B6N25_14685 [Sphingobacteriales bacterium TSM_CSS]PSJ78946.1 hypothetical protein C7N43_01300 [Sphingobacteriales bacterium UPWRP_1]